MMVDANEPADMNDVTTFREVSMSLKAINDRLDLMQKVFIGAVVLATGCFSYLFYTTTSNSNSVARIDGVLSGYTERFNGIDKRLNDIKAMIGTRQQGQVKCRAPLSPNQMCEKLWTLPYCLAPPVPRSRLALNSNMRSSFFQTVAVLLS
jgi:hypothetical protein